MRSQVEQATKWIYQGLWGVLVRWFRVPDRPPTLPVGRGEAPYAFQPSAGYLSYLKLQFWIWLVVFDGVVAFTWLAIAVASPVAGLVLLLPAVVLAVLPDIVAYIAIHLRYDTTWYVMTQRSLRIRRGIWVIHETTITFENVQNIKISQGPVQRFFGIADVLVETAGGGVAAAGAHGAQQGIGHQGLIQGVADAQGIRDMILARLRETPTAGLGDEADAHPSASDGARHSAGAAWSAEHVALLREIRAAALRLAG